MALEVPPSEILTAARRERTGTLASLALLVISISISIAGHVTLKSAMDHLGAIGSAQLSSPGGTIARAAAEPRLWGGLLLFGASALFWMVVLSRVPLSVAYPFVGISYVAIVAIARLVLGERVPPVRWAGVAVVALGIAIVGLSFRRG